MSSCQTCAGLKEVWLLPDGTTRSLWFTAWHRGLAEQVRKYPCPMCQECLVRKVVDVKSDSV